jgi:RNA polymerase sigma-70 factor, ECF subfamily
VRIRADVQAFSDNFEYLCRLLRRLGVKPDDVEDLAQEVFVVMCRRWAEYQPERSLRSWLAGIAFNTAQKYFARVWRERPTEGIELPDLGPQPDERLQIERARWLVQQALGNLSVRDRAVLSLRELDDLSMHEVADVLQIPLFTAYTRLRRARLRFAAVLGRLELARSGSPVAPLTATAVLALERRAQAERPGDRPRSSARALALVSGLIPTAPPARRRAFDRSEADVRPAPIGPLRVGLLGSMTVAIGALLTTIAPGGERVSARAMAGIGEQAPEAAPAPRPPRSVAVSSRERRALPVFVREPVPPLVATLAQGLTGYWRFDEVPGSETVKDVSTSQRDCVLHEVDASRGWLAGALGGGLDVGRGWLRCPQPAVVARPGTELTVAAWVKVTGFPSTGYAAVVARQLAEDSRDFFFLGLKGRQLVASSRYWGAIAVATREFPRGQWVHVAFARGSDGTLRLYQDGALVGSARRVARDRPQLVDTPVTIGSDLNGPENTRRGQQLKGAVDEVLTYDRALPPEQIAALAAGVQPP